MRVHSVRAQSKNVSYMRSTTFTVQAILTKSDSATKDMLQLLVQYHVKVLLMWKVLLRL